MQTNINEHLARATSQADWLPDWINQFYLAKRVEGVKDTTLRFYRQQLTLFMHYCDAQVIRSVWDVSSKDVRGFLLWLEETGHNPGGVHAAYRILKSFLRWWDAEVEPDGWHNPISKIKPPKLDETPLDPVELDVVKAMIGTCDKSFLGIRDRALLLALLDTGARARELLSLDVTDIDLISGDIFIEKGKGGKGRTTFLGKESRRAVRAYLKTRSDTSKALWVKSDGDRLAYGGLRAVLARRAEQAGVTRPTPHSFRRACALSMLRNGADLFTIARVLGHTDLKVLRRYLKQHTDDIRRVHVATSPVDNSDL